MKNQKLLKRILTCSLALALTASDVVPAMAAELPLSENEVTAEAAEVSESAGETTTETTATEVTETTETEPSETEAAETEAAETEAIETGIAAAAEEASSEIYGVPSLGEDSSESASESSSEGTSEVPETPKPSISQPTISCDWEEYYSWPYFYVNFSGTNYDECELTVTASGTGSVVKSDFYFSSGESIYAGNFYDSKTGKSGLTAGTAYTFTLKPYEGRYIEDEDGYSNYEKVYGDAKSVVWTAPAVEAVTGLAVKEMASNGFSFSHSAISKESTLRLEYCENAAFNKNIAPIQPIYSDTLSYSSLKPGVTYYVRAYAMRYGAQGSYSNVVSVIAPVAEVGDIETEIFDTGVTLTLSAGYGKSTGFEISRKQGSGKYKKLTTTTEIKYADTGLKKNTKYTYRVRAYYYNSDTKKKIYGDYSYQTVTTGSADLDLTAEAAGKTSIKLKWKKLADASGYDIYRYAGSSSGSTRKDGKYSSFSKYELIKTLKKKKTSFTNKKLTAGETYEYLVKAYKLVKGKKQYFTQSYDSATTKFSFSTSLNVYKQIQNPSNGTVKITWKQVPQAAGYLIEKEDPETGNWVTQANITNAKTTSYTLPASPLGKTVDYRIRAYKGNKYSNAREISVSGRAAVVTGVTAKAAANGIMVSWKPVAGASFYRVYRTTSAAQSYNADLKTYNYFDEDAVTPMVFKQAEVTDNYYCTLGNSTVKMKHDDEAEDKLLYHRPGSTYAYNDDAIIGTSVIDYSYSSHSPVYDENGTALKEKVDEYGPKSDIKYYYYVEAYVDQKDASSDYYTVTSSYGYSQAASAAMAPTAPAAPKKVSVKAGKKSATLTISKVTGATEYAIYRSTSKKGTYEFVGTTTKTKYKDSKLTAKKTYYYKVKAVAQNSLGADVYSGFSKVKSVKVKK